MMHQVLALDLGKIELWVNVYAVVLSLIGIVLSLRKARELWPTRHLRRVWGIRDGDAVTVVCSELDDPDERQMVEPREFIYNLKYGDVDAYFEVVTTLLRLYPRLRMRVMSAGEALSSRVNLARHLVLIGGPDYNALTERVLEEADTQYVYRSPDCAAQSAAHPDEIVVHDRRSDKEWCEQSDERDFGYFERFPNPYDQGSKIILIGGCHTIGVASAAKAVSSAESEDGSLSSLVLANARVISKQVGVAAHFSFMVKASRIGQTIRTPTVEKSMICAFPGEGRLQGRDLLGAIVLGGGVLSKCVALGRSLASRAKARRRGGGGARRGKDTEGGAR